MKYLAVIPARIGSKSLPRKNIQLLGGKPLIFWTIDAALKSKVCESVAISTESNDIAILVSSHYQDKVKIIIRPDYLADDDTTLAPVIAHACRQQSQAYNAVITLQPTSPLRDDMDIISAIAQYEISKADSLLSVCAELKSVWDRKPSGEIVCIKERLANRQQEAPLYIANGAIFITDWNLMLSKVNRLGNKVAIYTMDNDKSVDIHSKEDLELAEFLLGRKKGI